MDLVHEIDIAEYLLGTPLGKILSFASRISNVTIDSPDIAEIIYQTRYKSVMNIHMDYLYRGYSRHFTISGTKANLYCDLFENTIKITGDQNILIEMFEYKDFERNDMYLHLLENYINVLKDSYFYSKLPSFIENESVMNTCFQVNN